MACYIEKFNFQDSEEIENAFKKLLEKPINSVNTLENWLQSLSDLYSALEEGLTGHYFDFQRDTGSEPAKIAYEHDQEAIQPILKKYKALLDEKYYHSPFRLELDGEYYKRFDKYIQNAIQLFREENIALGVEENRLTNRYFEETGNLTVEWNGVEKTFSEMWPFLEDPDREVRKKAFMMRNEKMLMKENELQSIMSQLVHLRQQKAEHAGLPNYRDYMFKHYERFDYTPDDCKKLAEAIQKHVLPLKKKFQKEHQEKLNVKEYRPWDAAAVPKDQQPLKPFNSTEELISGTAEILSKVDPNFSKLLKTMNQKGMLDLDSRKGKAPGGFCEPLPLSELSVIFMNTSKTQHDVMILLHEMGHCVHHDLFMDIKLSRYRNVPMESAELASMTMELITMDHWDVFYSDTQDLKRAKKEQLTLMIEYLPFGVIIDQFQHWMYENPGHSVDERNQVFKKLRETYDSDFMDWSGNEEWSAKEWLGVLHIFELPFYYIEYVIAQFGAIQMYRQYKEDPKQTLINFKKALSLGSSKSLPEVYKAAGIRFDFSEEMVKELMAFVESELDGLE